MFEASFLEKSWIMWVRYKVLVRLCFQKIDKMLLEDYGYKFSVVPKGYHQLLERMVRTLLCALLLSVALCLTVVNNYQERQVYYNEDENLCLQGSGYDWVNLLITLDGNIFNEVTVKTQNYCTQWGKDYATQLRTISKWSFFDDSNNLKFQDEQRIVEFQGDLFGIVLNTTLVPQAVLGGSPCTCVILGNGEVFHYGGSPQFEPPTFDIKCTTVDNQ